MTKEELEAKPAKSGIASKSGNSAKNRERPEARPKQKFTVSHHREADFKQGLRAYAKYRDLGDRGRRREAWRRLTSFASFPRSGRRKPQRLTITMSISR